MKLGTHADWEGVSYEDMVELGGNEGVVVRLTEFTWNESPAGDLSPPPA